jgi:hypothetical protein
LPAPLEGGVEEEEPEAADDEPPVDVLGVDELEDDEAELAELSAFAAFV